MDTQTLNNLWQNIIPPLKRSCIVADHDFYNAAADQFTITVVDDETDKCERPYETVLEAGFVYALATTRRDLVGFFLHVASHQRCDLFWQRCPVPMEQFTPHQLDFIEEVYNQRLVSVVAPYFYDAFPTVNQMYDVYKGFDVAKRRPLQTMFTKQCQTGNRQFDTVHRWLYDNDPLNQNTFTMYMKFWQLFMKNVPCVQAIEQYES